jgi:RNA-directed DNA polymerase
MNDPRQKNQLQRVLAFAEEGRSEAPRTPREGTEAYTANCETESPAGTKQRMEEVCGRENCQQAVRRVKANKGSAGIDGMKVAELPGYLKQHWPAIREQLLSRTYRPQAVRRVEIAKPDGGMRKLGIPTVLDRFIQQAVMQVLQGRWDGTFSKHSHGFRPQRSAHQAVAKAQQYIAAGNRGVVDLDLEKFFDQVNHDRLMAAIARRVNDKRMLKLIRAILESGVMENGLVSAVEEGTPQGGPLSPLLSHLVLDELDRELQRRQHRFVRYADDCNSYVASERAGKRVMQSVTSFIRRRLKLTVNETKSAVARPQEGKFLGFSFTYGAEPKPPDARDQYATEDEGPGLILAWLEGLLRLQPDALATAQARGMDPTQVAIHDLEAMEGKAGAVCEAAPAEHRRCPSASNRRQSPWTMAHRQQSGPGICVSDCLRRRSRSSAIAG